MFRTMGMVINFMSRVAHNDLARWCPCQDPLKVVHKKTLSLLFNLKTFLLIIFLDPFSMPSEGSKNAAY